MKASTRDRHYHAVAKALSYIQQQQYHQPSLAEVASHCAMSEHHFQRIFTEWAGVSPKQFLQHLTRQNAKARLINGDSMAHACMENGLSSSSRLHDLMVQLEAVTPGQIQSRGCSMTFHWGIHNTPFGDCFMVTTERGIHRLSFIINNNKETLLQKLQQQWPKASIIEDHSHTSHYVQQVFSKANHHAPNTIKVWTQGSEFQLKVWEALLAIPSGRLTSYSAIAQAINKPSAARAVGTAIGKNEVALLIPCHRVIKSIGEIGHYRWEHSRKLALIGSEACE